METMVLVSFCAILFRACVGESNRTLRDFDFVQVSGNWRSDFLPLLAPCNVVAKTSVSLSRIFLHFLCLISIISYDYIDTSTSPIKLFVHNGILYVFWFER